MVSSARTKAIVIIIYWPLCGDRLLQKALPFSVWLHKTNSENCKMDLRNCRCWSIKLQCFFRRTGAIRQAIAQSCHKVNDHFQFIRPQNNIWRIFLSMRKLIISSLVMFKHEGISLPIPLSRNGHLCVSGKLLVPFKCCSKSGK